MREEYLLPNEIKLVRNVEKIKDESELLKALNEVSLNIKGLQCYWAFKDSFERLKTPFEELSASVKCVKILLEVLKGNIEYAEELYEKLKNTEDEYYYRFACFSLPTASDDEFLESANYIMDNNISLADRLILNANRPSVINGIRDFYAFSDKIFDDPKEVIPFIKTMHPETAEYVSLVAQAEVLYQQNRFYEALIKITAAIPFLREKENFRVYFVALSVQMRILITGGQVKTTVPLTNDLKNKIKECNNSEFLFNISAIEAWTAMYEGDQAKVNYWLENEAPDEISDFCMMDVMAYFIKMRAYIIQEKYLSAIALGRKVEPLLNKASRNGDRCECLVLLAIATYKEKHYEDSFSYFSEALKLAIKYKFVRKIADEGLMSVKLMNEFKNQCEDKEKLEFMETALEPAREIASLYPNYLQPFTAGFEKLSKTEKIVLRFCAAGHTNDEIAGEMCISVSTVKFHLSNIFAKLNVKNRNMAVRRAEELGII